MYCKNCGKPITSIATECPYCHEKVIENNSNNNVMYNKQNLYNNMNNRQQHSLLGTIIAIILIVVGVIGIIGTFGDEVQWAKNWGGMLPDERIEKGDAIIKGKN